MGTNTGLQRLEPRLRLRHHLLPPEVLQIEITHCQSGDYGADGKVLDQKKERTSLEESTERVIIALQYRDEISVLELSKRTLLTRRTVERVLQLIQKVQQTCYEFEFLKIGGEVVKQKRRNLYDLDESRMIYVLEKRYLGKRRQIPKSKDQVLMRL
jgi:hypothetical protein